jgi:DNA-binding MarR family transcriptional regulator
VTSTITSTRSNDSTAEVRATLAQELIDELAGWSPPDRLRAFTGWHRGSLSLVQLIVLTVLEGDGALPMRRLAEALDVSDASATGIVSRMEKRDLVERRHGTEDRREVLVHLTDAGASVFHELQQRRRARLTTMVDQLTDAELASLLTGLRAMRAAVVRLHAEHGGDGPDDVGVTDAAHADAPLVGLPATTGVTR